MPAPVCVAGGSWSSGLVGLGSVRRHCVSSPAASSRAGKASYLIGRRVRLGLRTTQELDGNTAIGKSLNLYGNDIRLFIAINPLKAAT